MKTIASRLSIHRLEVPTFLKSCTIQIHDCVKELILCSCINNVMRPVTTITYHAYTINGLPKTTAGDGNNFQSLISNKNVKTEQSKLEHSMMINIPLNNFC